MAWTRWAEETLTRLERSLGLNFTFRRREPIEIHLISGRDASVVPEYAARVNSGFFQRVIVVNVALPCDQEILDELLCRALITGYVRDRCMGRVDAVMPSIPEWLTMGIAQNLSPELWRRNRTVVMGWREDSTCPRLMDALNWQRLPAGWPRYRSFCGMMVHWFGAVAEVSLLTPLEGKSQSMAGATTDAYVRILDQLADEGAVAPVWLASELTLTGTVEGMEKRWQEWLGTQGNIIQSFGEISSDLIERLRGELSLEVLPTGNVAMVSSTWLTPSEAIERRREPGVSLAAGIKAQRIRFLTIGKAEELVKAGEMYAQFFDGVAVDKWSWTLRRNLRGAEKELEALTDLTQKREAYLDAVEREQNERSSAWRVGESGREPVLDKGRLERYVDAAEKKYDVTVQGESRDEGHDSKENNTENNGGCH
jgi:hypothetical protein